MAQPELEHETCGTERQTASHSAIQAQTIQEFSSVQQWHHSAENPADILSREMDPERLLNHKLWCNDLDFLSGNDCAGRVIPISGECEAFNSELKTLY
ncbi:hypothetical protein CDAR_41841 [Caerostris darwini]|uniref:Uncharacterized protein n=1 Tax=Caerostris darwini TaxID=1538125 RepID=A0AAV4W9T3_9ARAC|nr:hypothetical protein CDAR_41841 [Caerostris darwini]